ncbi:hypothetical protein [Nocardioides xinjiangensis]|uniref:hypothetical protein n=1 Tax=Nocardioides xinjiangensis TaxID=2817376 RepID=UPI001B30300E|nr:hypothetical protein [Nocardioides sp. SYSU D00514]
MSTEMVRKALAEHARDVSSTGPDLAGLHDRIATEHRHRRVRTAAASVALAAAVIAGAVLGRAMDGGAPDPAPAPQPTPTLTPTPDWTPGQPLPYRPDPVEVFPAPYDRAAVQPAHVLATVRNDPGNPTLQWMVDRTADMTHVQQSCRGADDTWLVVKGARGSSSTTPCGASGGFQDEPMPTMPFLVDHNPVLPGIGEPLDAFVTTVDPADTNGPGGAQLGIPPDTSATFELVVWGQDFSPVATILGRDVSPLGVAAGRDWWFTRGVEAPTGADALVLELPASPVDRVVQTVADYARFEPGGTMPYVEISVDGRRVDHRFDSPRVAFQDETTAFVPAGERRTVVLEVTDGKPGDIDFGAAVFEAGDRR